MAATKILRGANSSSTMDRVRRLSAALGVKQVDIAASLGIKPAQLNMYFQGKAEIRAARLIEILKIFGIDVDAMLDQRLAEVERSARRKKSSPESKVLANLAHLDERRRENLLKIIEVMVAKK